MKSLATIAVLAGFAVVVLAQEPEAPPRGMTLRIELFVKDVDRSVEFYTKVLGFERMPGTPEYAPVRSGAVVIGLGPLSKLPERHYFNPEAQAGRLGIGAEIVLEVDDVAAAYEQVKRQGYKILSPLVKRPWGATDFRLADPDGYYLRITSR